MPTWAGSTGAYVMLCHIFYTGKKGGHAYVKSNITILAPGGKMSTKHPVGSM